MAKGDRKKQGQDAEPAATQSAEDKSPAEPTTTVRLFIKDASGLTALANLARFGNAAEAFQEYFSAELDHLLVRLASDRLKPGDAPPADPKG